MYLYLVLGAGLLGVSVASTLAALGTRRTRTVERLSTIHDYGFTAEPQVETYLTQQPQTSALASAATR